MTFGLYKATHSTSVRLYGISPLYEWVLTQQITTGNKYWFDPIKIVLSFISSFSTNNIHLWNISVSKNWFSKVLHRHIGEFPSSRKCPCSCGHEFVSYSYWRLKFNLFFTTKYFNWKNMKIDKGFEISSTHTTIKRNFIWHSFADRSILSTPV